MDGNHSRNDVVQPHDPFKMLIKRAESKIAFFFVRKSRFFSTSDTTDILGLAYWIFLGK